MPYQSRAALLSVIALLVTDCATPPASPARLAVDPVGTPAAGPGPAFARGYDVLSYDLDLSLLAGDGSFDGTLALTFTSRRAALAEVDLDALDLEVVSVSEAASARRFDVAAGRLRIALDPPIPDGAARTLSIRYHGRPSKGLHWFADHVYTAFHTRRWMPCNFDPEDKATFDLALSVAPTWKVLGNGTPLDTTPIPGGARHRWRLDVPHAAYLFGFVAGRLAQATRPAATGTPLLEVLATEKTPPAVVDRLLDETPGMIRFFEQASGMPFPGRRYGAAFVGGGTAQELATLSELGDDYAQIWSDAPTEDWLAAHELAHQWWGNAATCATWNDLWIQEAFAVFMTAAYKEKRWGRAAYERELGLWAARLEKLRAAGADRPLAAISGPEPDASARKLRYCKGPLALLAAREALGDAAFWGAVRDFTRSAVASASRTADLEAALERAAGRRLPEFHRAVFGPER